MAMSDLLLTLGEGRLKEVAFQVKVPGKVLTYWYLDELSIERIQLFKSALVRWLLAQAADKLKKPQSEIKVRTAFPKDDFNFATQQWITPAPSAANTWTEYFSLPAIPDQKFVLFYGLANLSPDPGIIAIKFERGAETLGEFHFQDMYLRDIPAILFERPVRYFQGEPIKVSFYSTKTQSEELVLFALVAEPKEFKIS